MVNTQQDANGTTGSGRPPLAVWPCARDIPTHPDDGSGTGRGAGRVVPVELARRLVAEYGTAGGLVVGLRLRSGAVPVQAALAGRWAVAIDVDSEQAQRVAGDVATHLPLDLHREVRVLCADACHPGELGRVARKADLVVIEVPRYAVPPSRRRHPGEVGPEAEGVCPARFGEFMASIFCAAALLVRPGGYVAAVCLRDSSTDQSDRLGVCVQAAAEAGLPYLQHVIALSAPITGDRLEPAADPVAPSDAGQEVGEGLTVEHARAAATVITPAHDDVCVFTAPAADVTVEAEVGA